MKKLVLFTFLSVIISGLVLVNPVRFSLAQTSTSFTISGHILDSDGHGIDGAHIIFNMPSVVPSVISDSSGYYVISAPAGTYHINVWPPFDSNFIHYDELEFVVESDVTKNITLTLGQKVSGYISDSSGNPVSNAAVLLDGFGSGWFSDNSGYYFVNVPAGTYNLRVTPRYGHDHFSSYFESNLTINGETTKNITVSDHSPPQSPTPDEPSPEPSPTQNSTSFTISGYILDSDGHGIADAMIIFSVPQIVPAVYSDSSGYYVTYAPAGTYHVRVWPPFDSNFLSFDQPEFTVGTSNISKNITLSSGYKLSGYLTDYSGAPIRGALASLDQLLCGWYSKNTGYYFVTAPAGTYKLTIQPKTGPTFLTHNENNFAITGDTVKNFTLTTSANTPTQTSPTPNSTSNPTPTSTLPSTLISITTEATTFQVGSAVNVKGKLTDQNANILVNKTVFLSHSVGNSASWIQIGSDKTNTYGEYNIRWVVGASGNFTLKAEWPGDASYSVADNSTTLSFMPYQDQQVFDFESNSTVSALAFNSTSSELGFVVIGPNGTKGYVKITIAKTLVSNAENIKVYLDGNQLNYEITSNTDSWLLFFTYTHSTHQVKIDLAANMSEITLFGNEYWSWIVVVIIIVVIGGSLLVYFKKRRH